MRADWQLIEDVTLPASGVAVELAFTGASRLEVHVVDVQLGLGDAGGAVLAARPTWAVPDRPRRSDRGLPLAARDALSRRAQTRRAPPMES
jgi:hypothetical protein